MSYHYLTAKTHRAHFTFRTFPHVLTYLFINQPSRILNAKIFLTINIFTITIVCNNREPNWKILNENIAILPHG